MMSVLLLLQLVFAEAVSGEPGGEKFSKEQQQLSQSISTLSDEIHFLNKNISCKKKSDCVAIAMGKAICGGPQYFTVASKKNKNLSKIEKKAVKHGQLSDEFNKKFRPGMMGICRVVTAPDLACENRKCVEVKTNE